MISDEKKQELQNFYIANCWKNETFGDMLKRISKKYNEKVALKDAFYSISFNEWDILSDKGAAYFFNEGFRSGDKVIIQLPNSVVFLVISFSLFKLGVVPVFALPAHREREILAFISKTDAKAYITTEKHLGYSYKEIGDKCSCNVYYEKTIFENIRNTEICPVVSDAKPEDTAILLVSGGTTGIPKLIPRTHADYLYDAEKFAETLKLDENTVFLASIPVAHNFTFANPGVIGTALFGGKTILSRNGSADEILDLIRSENVTITALVPSLLELCSEMASWEDEPFPSLKTVMAGGSVLMKSTVEKAEKYLGCKVRQVFGTAEGLNTITPEDMPSDKIADCQGKAISEFDETLIIDEDGEILPNGAEGELIIRGPYTIRNYYNNPEADKEAFLENGFYRTGDRAYIDENGLHVCGRVREQINRAGEKIMPKELDELLKSHENISDAAVIGIPDTTLGNKICACVVFEGKELSLAEIRDFMLAKGLAEYKLPDCIMSIESMPLTAVGKIDKKVLLKRYGE